MLVLSRVKNETVIIAGNITVLVIHIGDGKVKLGIDAPDYITIHRGEIQDRIDAERSTNNGTDRNT